MYYHIMMRCICWVQYVDCGGAIRAGAQVVGDTAAGGDAGPTGWVAGSCSR